MACAFAKYTGKLGVCLATSGPGGIHLLNGLYDAKMDGQPVLAITGLQFHDLIGTYTQQDVALDKLFMDVAVFNERVMGPTHVENLVDFGVRTALSYRMVSHITFPVDLQEKEVARRHRSKRNVPHHSARGEAERAVLPDPSEFDEAAAILNAGKKVEILAGRGTLHATDELEQTAEILAAPIVRALLGKAAVPDDSPYTTGGIGLLGTRPSQDVMENCDTLFLVGSSFPYIEFLPKPGEAKGVQIDADPKRIGLRLQKQLQKVFVYFDNDQAGFAAKNAPELKRVGFGRKILLHRVAASRLADVALLGGVGERIPRPLLRPSAITKVTDEDAG